MQLQHPFTLTQTKLSYLNSWKCVSGSPPCRPVCGPLQQWHVGPRAETPQSKCWIKHWFAYVWDTFPMLIIAGEKEQRIEPRQITVYPVTRTWGGLCSLCWFAWCLTPSDNHNLFDKSGKSHTASVVCFNRCPTEYTTYNIFHKHLITITVWLHTHTYFLCEPTQRSPSCRKFFIFIPDSNELQMKM